MDDVPVTVQQYISIVSILNLQKVGQQRICRQAFNEMSLGNTEGFGAPGAPGLREKVI